MNSHKALIKVEDKVQQEKESPGKHQGPGKFPATTWSLNLLFMYNEYLLGGSLGRHFHGVFNNP